jgi:thiamine-phosphate pyrophosphorylase
VIISLVTDRRRLAPEATIERARARLVVQARDAADAGVDLLQIREGDLDARSLAALVTDVVAATSGTRTRVVVNERLDVALACGAAGVHLRADSIDVASVRRMAPAGFLVGRSVHAASEVAANIAADYIIAGTVFASASKGPDHRLLGLDGLELIVAAAQVHGVPVLAIGGVTETEVEAIARTGAAGVAAIGLFASPGTASLKQVVETVRLRFDTARSAP